MTIILLSLIIFIGLLSTSPAFVLFPTRNRRNASSFTALKMTLLNYKGKKVEVKAGTPLSQACVKLGLKPTYSCKK